MKLVVERDLPQSDDSRKTSYWTSDTNNRWKYSRKVDRFNLAIWLNTDLNGGQKIFAMIEIVRKAFSTWQKVLRLVEEVHLERVWAGDRPGRLQTFVKTTRGALCFYWSYRNNNK